jgi:hypothetical protein
MKIADDAAAIKARMEEIQQERMQAIMGKPIEETQTIILDAADITWTTFSGTGYLDDLPTA